ncbi:MAG: SRPBCC family protein [Crocinitomicaceae bacterium]
MPTITFETKIAAPIARVFDLARSIDLHLITSRSLKEKVIKGRKSGLISQGEIVGWQVYLHGIPYRITSKITAMNIPACFTDVQISGPFAYFEHQHYFYCEGDKTRMKDVFKFASPLGFLGKSIDYFFLTKLLHNYLFKRNMAIKYYAENDEKWMQLLNIY